MKLRSMTFLPVMLIVYCVYYYFNTFIIIVTLLIKDLALLIR